MIRIYSKEGVVRCTVEPESNSQQSKQLQGDNVLSLSFTLPECVELDVNDYADFEGERYRLMSRYVPKEVSSVEWVYDVQLYGLESMIKRYLVLQNSDGENEPVFTLTAKAVEHVRLIVKSINDGMGTEDWKVGSVVDTENLTVDYEGTYCDEGLSQVASAAETEWWVEGMTVNVCRCEHGEVLDLEYGKEVTSIERDNADGVKFYTRLFPVGSSRNIDREQYGHVRLQLPDGKKYVDDGVEDYGVIHHYEEAAFADIYPRRTGRVSSVRKKDTKDTDGNPLTIYYFTDDDLDFDPNDYEIGGLVKHVVFASGELTGRDFEVNVSNATRYNNKTKERVETREFEIITVWPYDDDTQLPGGVLVPKEGDEYILWNIRMPEEYYALAEQEFLAAVEEWNAKHRVDVAVYKCPTNPIWADETHPELGIGRRVRLRSREHFPATGYRESRITRISRNVAEPGQVDLEISDVVSTGTLSKITDSVNDVKVMVKETTSSLPDIIRSGDGTPPTDNNLYSARRQHKEFLSKRQADTAAELLTLMKGLHTGTYVPGESGGMADADGNAEWASAVIRAALSSPVFASGFGGSGMKIWEAGGEWNMETDRLTVRGTMNVYELLIQKIRAVGGQLLLSAASGKVASVESVDGAGEMALMWGGWRIGFEDEAGYAVNDLVLCQTFTGKTVKRWWARVVYVHEDGSVVVEKKYDGTDDVWDGCDAPEVGDETVLCGNTRNGERQSVVVLSAVGSGGADGRVDNAPYGTVHGDNIAVQGEEEKEETGGSTGSGTVGNGQPTLTMYSGVSKRSFEGALKTRVGYLGDITDGGEEGFGQLAGYGLYSENAYLKGTFKVKNRKGAYVEIDESIRLMLDEAGMKVEDGVVKLVGGKVEFVGADDKPYIKVGHSDSRGTYFEFGYVDSNDEWVACYDLGWHGLNQIANSANRRSWGRARLLGPFSEGESVSAWDVWMGYARGDRVKNFVGYVYHQAYIVQENGTVLWLPGGKEGYDGTWWTSDGEDEDGLPGGESVSSEYNHFPESGEWYFGDYTQNASGEVRTYKVYRIADGDVPGAVVETKRLCVEKEGSGASATFTIYEEGHAAVDGGGPEWTF